MGADGIRNSVARVAPVRGAPRESRMRAGPIQGLLSLSRLRATIDAQAASTGHDVLRTLAWCGKASVVAAAILCLTHTGLALQPMLTVAGLVALGGVLTGIYTWVRPERCIAALIGGLAALVWSGTMAGIVALAGLRVQAPFIDPVLAQADAILGIDVLQITTWVAARPVAVQLLSMAYVGSVPAVFGSVLLLAMNQRQSRMWHVVQVFGLSGMAASLMSIPIPALGFFGHIGLPPEVLARLPAGAGSYSFPILEEFRQHGANVIDVFHLEGVVTFPSFHATMGTIVAWALWGVPRLRCAGALMGALIIASAIPMGGHYAVDVLAGVVVCGAAVIVTGRAPRRSAK